MNDKHVKYKSGIIAGLIEVMVTHPIDFYKTQKQFYAYSNNLKKKFRIANMYNGIFTRMVGIIPMRITFWCSHDISEEYLQKKSFGNIRFALAGGFAGTCQTFIDYPTEQIKIRRMIYRDSYLNIFKDFANSSNILKGFSFTLLRNIGFASIFNFILKNNTNNYDPFYHNFLIAAGSGFIASVLTQPLDYFKTVIQSNKESKKNLNEIYTNSLTSQNKQLFNMKHLVFFNGVWSRSSISFLGMGIGFSVYDKFKKLLTQS